MLSSFSSEAFEQSLFLNGLDNATMEMYQILTRSAERGRLVALQPLGSVDDLIISIVQDIYFEDGEAIVVLHPIELTGKILQNHRFRLADIAMVCLLQ